MRVSPGALPGTSGPTLIECCIVHDTCVFLCAAAVAEDPVALGKPLVPDAVLKLLKDMFADRTTAGLFYTSDTHVLIGIVARQLNDLPEGSEVSFIQKRSHCVCTCVSDSLLRVQPFA